MPINWDTINRATTTFVANDNDKAGKQLAERITLAQTAWRTVEPAWQACELDRTPKAQAQPLKVGAFITWAKAAAKASGTALSTTDERAITAIVAIRFHTLETLSAFNKWVADGDNRNGNIESYRTFLPQYARGEWTPGGKPSAARKRRMDTSKVRRETRTATAVDVDVDVSFSGVVVGSNWKAGLTKLVLLKHNLEREIAIAMSKLSESEAKEAVTAAEAEIRKAVKAS